VKNWISLKKLLGKKKKPFHIPTPWLKIGMRRYFPLEKLIEMLG